MGVLRWIGSGNLLLRSNPAKAEAWLDAAARSNSGRDQTTLLQEIKARAMPEGKGNSESAAAFSFGRPKCEGQNVAGGQHVASHIKYREEGHPTLTLAVVPAVCAWARRRLRVPLCDEGSNCRGAGFQPAVRPACNAHICVDLAS